MWFWEKEKMWMARFSFFVVTKVRGPRFKGGGYMDQLHWSRNRRPRIGIRRFPYVVACIRSSPGLRPPRSPHLYRSSVHKGDKGQKANSDAAYQDSVTAPLSKLM